MKVLAHFRDIDAGAVPVVLAIGYFDGVHKGHQAVIGQAVERAARIGGQAWVLTLEPHPLKILKPEIAPALLTSTSHKLELLKASGLVGCVVLPFTRELATKEPEDFLRDLRQAVPGLREIVVGRNWTFGHRARGNVDLLQQLSTTFGFEAVVVEPVLWEGGAISSSRVRQEICSGSLEKARQMLGRPFSVYGTVIPGKRFGRELGFPTANIDPHNEVRPPAGIYAVLARFEGRQLPGAAFLGGRSASHKTPTGFVVEVHLIDASPELYGKDMEVLFIQKIREEQRFDSPVELSRQIGLDVAEARRILLRATL